jgi:hypothetical protein
MVIQMIKVTIQNPERPEKVHVIPMKDINNAMCAVMSLSLAFDDAGLANRARPLVWFDTNEIGYVGQTPNGIWCEYTKLMDGRRVPGVRRYSVSDLTNQPVVAGRLAADEVNSLPSWVWTWAALVGL